MRARLTQEYIALAVTFGIKSVGEYICLVKDLKEIA